MSLVKNRLSNLLPHARCQWTEAFCSCPQAIVQSAFQLSDNKKKRYVFEFGGGISVVRIQPEEKEILPLESTAFRLEMEDIVGRPISDNDADNIIVGLMYVALGCEASAEPQTEPQSQTREELRQMMIRKCRPKIGKAMFSPAPRTKTNDWGLELEEHEGDCRTTYVISEVCQVHPVMIRC